MIQANREELHAVLQQLEQAISSHEEWFQSLNRQMLCRLPYDRREVSDDAYRECRFGQWLYEYSNPHVRKHPAFDAIEREHKVMHQSAAKILLNAEKTGGAEPDEYDRFSNAMQNLRLEINTLKHEIETTYHNLDSLTGANNRLGMLTHLREQAELVKRGSQKCCLALMDVDHFKQINDAYGHVVGDRVLSSATRYILEHIRVYDRLYRYGGEEFLLCMSHMNPTEAMLMAVRLREGIRELEIVATEQESLHLTVSFGVIELTPELSVEEAIMRADQALYDAKASGRNCCKLWASETAKQV